MGKELSFKYMIDINNISFDEPVFTPSEISEKLGVSIQTINRWDRNGEFVAKRIKPNGKNVYRYYTETQYVEFVNSNKYLNMNHIKNSDIIGETFGKLKVLSFSESAIRKGYYGSYICECSCGNTVELKRYKLINHKIKSCGCKFHDLTNKQFGRWHVDSIAQAYNTPCGSKIIQYNCTCDCGTKRVVTARALTSGASQSCGCLHSEIISSMFLNDLKDKVFGDLTVKQRVETKWSPSGKTMYTMWKCKCKCGNTINVSSVNLLSGRIDSCGCRNNANRGSSKYETHVIQYLESIGLIEGDGFILHKTFPDLLGVGGGFLSYDLFVTIRNKSWLIECQGEQHYKPVEWYGGIKFFEKQKEHDLRKRNYAQRVGIQLIEIPFTCVSYNDVKTILNNSGIK